MLTLFLADPDTAKWFALADAVLTLLVTVAAVTPTEKDDRVVDRLVNLSRVLRGAK